jgi:hypothetical protein
VRRRVEGRDRGRGRGEGRGMREEGEDERGGG